MKPLGTVTTEEVGWEDEEMENRTMTTKQVSPNPQQEAMATPLSKSKSENDVRFNSYEIAPLDDSVQSHTDPMERGNVKDKVIAQMEKLSDVNTHHNVDNGNVGKIYRAKKTCNYVRREGALRIKALEAKKKLELKILKAKLDTQQTKKETAKILLEASKLELKYQLNRLRSQAAAPYTDD